MQSHVATVSQRCWPRRQRWAHVPAVRDEPEIVIGAPNSLTGGFGENGQRAVWGFLIAIEQINREGGIKSLGGAKLKPIVADTTTENPTQGASVTRRIIDQDHAVMLFGSTASAITLPRRWKPRSRRSPSSPSLLCRPADPARHEIHLQDHRSWQPELELRDGWRWWT